MAQLVGKAVFHSQMIKPHPRSTTKGFPMTQELRQVADLIESDKTVSEDFAHVQLPESMSGVMVRRCDTEMFHGQKSAEKDPRKSLHIGEVPLPELGPNEVLVAVMAAAINYNSVWTSIFEPAPGFTYLADFARMNKYNKKHLQDFHIIGSDGSGVIIRTGAAVTRWKPGDRVTIHGIVVDPEAPENYSDSMRNPNMRAWGFETNFGAFADFTVVRQNQLLPKPEHLSWEEAASVTATASTTYRMLVSDRGAQMKQGDNVLIWGASGGLGAFAIQMTLNGGGFPIGIVSSEKKAEMVRKLGCSAVIVLDRKNGDGHFLTPDGGVALRKIQRLKVKIRRLTGGEDADIVFEHTGRSTFGASVGVTKIGGKVVTCGSTSGYEHTFDNRYLWQTVKSIIGAHGANYVEAMNAVRLVQKGSITPVLSKVFPFEQASNAVHLVHSRNNIGKVGLLCLAQNEGTGIRNRELRERIGEDRINVFREAAV